MQQNPGGYEQEKPIERAVCERNPLRHLVSRAGGLLRAEIVGRGHFASTLFPLQAAADANDASISDESQPAVSQAERGEPPPVNNGDCIFARE